jgi:nucleoside-diphosphate-sugar epimerase
MAENERFLVTGASGAIGAWVVKHLLESGVSVVALTTDDDRRLRLITPPDQLASLRRVRSDVDDTTKLQAAVDDSTHIVHTQTVTSDDAASDPGSAAATMVGGLGAVLGQAANGRKRGIAFESSMSVFGPSDRPVDESTRPAPASLMGRLYLTTELIADRWFRSAGVASIGLRPNLVYGPGHDLGPQGQTTRAIAAAIDGRSVRLGHTGLADFQFVSDVALAFIAAARAATDRHRMINLRGQCATFSAFAQSVAVSTGVDEVSAGAAVYPVPVAAELEANPCISHLDTRLEEGIRSSLETFRWAPRDLYRHGVQRWE